MRIVEDEIFYHIQRKSNGIEAPLWEVDEHILIGQDKNRFFDFIERYSITGYKKDNLEHLNAILNHYLKVARELIFEEVRKEYFSDYPSRQRCLWVINNSDENLVFWKNKLTKYDRILKVKLSGKIFIANESFLDIRTLSVNNLREEAKKYWSGENNNLIGNEVLFEGSVEVVEII